MLLLVFFTVAHELTLRDSLPGPCDFASLPSVVRLRLSHVSTTVFSISSSPIPDFSGLDRVLIWLLRLLGTKEEAFGVKVGCHVTAQTVRLALQLARLLGSAAASASANVSHRRSSTGTASIADFTWDDLVILLAADVRATLGSIESDVGLSHYRFSVPNPRTLFKRTINFKHLDITTGVACI